LYVQKDNSNLDTRYFLIFEDIKSMLRPKVKDGHVVFANIPKNEKVKVLGVKLEDGKPYIAVKDYTTKAKNNLNLEFQPGSLAMIKKELSRLDG